MRIKRTLPLNLTVFALAAVLLRAEAKAEIKVELDHKARGKDARDRKAKGQASVRNRGHSGSHPRTLRTRLRERARLFEPFIAAAARKHGVDPRVLWTIAYLESRFRPEAVSPAAARGLMQFMPGTARRFKLTNPHDSIASIDAAARYVKELTDHFGPRLDLVLAGYNAGESAVECYRSGRTLRTSSGKVINRRGIKTNGVPPYKETVAYVKRGQLVFARLGAAGVFTPELIGSVRQLEPLDIKIAVNDQAMIDRELHRMGVVGPAVLFSGITQSGIGEQAKMTERVNGAVTKRVEVETVFFDVHSGTRYLVSEGEIVKPLPTLKGDDEGLKERNQRHVTKSFYVGMGGN
jgi:hypothetical protein